MNRPSTHPSMIAPVATTRVPPQMQSARVLLVGLGNIGSFLAIMLAPLVAFLRLVDRDRVEHRNTANQFYGPGHVGYTKVDVTSSRLRELAPRLAIERRVTDVEDLPWGDFCDVDLVLAGLDSLHARQIVAERTYALGKPYIDGAVGDLADVRVQVLLSGSACLECAWSATHYRHLATEYPCDPGSAPGAARTIAPGCAGAATAAVMLAQCIRLLGDDPPRDSYEITGDLLAARLASARRCLNTKCRFDHQTRPAEYRLPQPFEQATVGALLDCVRREFGGAAVQLTLRRGLAGENLFGAASLVTPEALEPLATRQLSELGLTDRDRIVVRANDRSGAAHIRLDDVNQGS
jgi:molybdopterin/thiamine biosynthesis adenylyltransferase